MISSESFVQLLFRATEKVAKRSRAFEKRGKQNLFVRPKRFIKKGFTIFRFLVILSFTSDVPDSLRKHVTIGVNKNSPSVML